MRDAYVANVTKLTEILLRPPTAITDATLDELFVPGKALDDMVTLRDTYRQKGWRIAKRADRPIESLSIEKVTLLDGPPVTSAEVVACRATNLVTYDTSGSTNPKAWKVVTDALTTTRTKTTLRLVNAVWKYVNTDLISRTEGANRCTAAP